MWEVSVFTAKNSKSQTIRICVSDTLPYSTVHVSISRTLLSNS